MQNSKRTTLIVIVRRNGTLKRFYMPSLSLDSADREREVGEVHIISYRVLLLHIYLLTFSPVQNH